MPPSSPTPLVQPVDVATHSGPSKSSILERRRQLLALATQTLVREDVDEDLHLSEPSDTTAKRKKAKQIRKKQKGKGKQKADLVVSEDDAHASDDSQQGGTKKKSGRLSKAVKAEAFAIRQRYHDELEALAKKSGKNFAIDIHDRYIKLRDGEVGEGELDLDGVVKWYRKELAQDTAEKRSGGHTKKEIEKLCLPFISAFIGWIVDPVSAQAVPWGSDPLYVALRNSNPAQITAQAVDYGTMFHTQLMLQDQAGAVLDPAKQALVNRFVDEGTDKEVLRGLLKDVLLMSLRDVRPNKEFKKMKWGSAFADLCFQEKVKLINYPVGMKLIGPDEGYAGAAFIPVHHLKFIVKRYVQFWQQQAKAMKAEAARARDATALFDEDEDEDETSGEDKVFEEDLVRFVPWDDDERLLTLEEQAHIGILLQEPRGNKQPVVLAQVLHSKIFLKHAAGRHIQIDLPDKEIFLKCAAGRHDLPDKACGDSDSDENLSGYDTDTDVDTRRPWKMLHQQAADINAGNEDQIPVRHHKKNTTQRHVSEEPLDGRNHAHRARSEGVKARPKEQKRRSGSPHRRSKKAPVPGDESSAGQRPRPRARAPVSEDDVSEDERGVEPRLQARAQARARGPVSGDERGAEQHPRPRPRHRARAPVSGDESDVEQRPRPRAQVPEPADKRGAERRPRPRPRMIPAGGS
ncbi:hypothetical protein C8R42DRAFT_726523 [Lentinula raphanica]|nr:hypothetical protein C8R42DRAFT_726523 [Lentinula raphanica]